MNLLVVILVNLIAIAPLVLCPKHEKKNAASATAPNARLVRPASAAGRYPDTVPGKSAKAFFEAFNSNDAGKVGVLSTALWPSAGHRRTYFRIHCMSATGPPPTGSKHPA